MTVLVTRSGQSSSLLGIGQLGQIQLGTGGTIIGTGTIDATLVPQNFTVKRAPEGPQILISWDAPSGLDTYSVKLVRTGQTFACKAADGKVLLDTTLTVTAQDRRDEETRYYHSDRDDLTDGKVYYYSLFILDSTTASPTEVFLTTSTLQASTAAFQTGYWPAKLFALLPNIYQSIDKRPDTGGTFGQKILTQTTGSSTHGALENAVFNFGESQVETRGQLERFLKIFGLQLDEATGLIDQVRREFNIEDCEGRFLEFMGSTIGVDVNRELAIARQRAEVRTGVRRYRYKGANTSVQLGIMSGTGVRSVPIYDIRPVVMQASQLAKTVATPLYGYPGAADPSEVRRTRDRWFSNPTNLGTRARALMFDDGRGDDGGTSMGTLFSPINDNPGSGGDPDWRIEYSRLMRPGSFTVEMGLRIRRTPDPDEANVSDLPTTTTITKTNLFRCTSNSNPVANQRSIFTIALATTRLAGSGTDVREILIYGGSDLVSSIRNDTIAPLLRVSEAEGHFKLNQNFHLAVRRKMNKGPSFTESPTPADAATWTVLIDGVEIATADEDHDATKRNMVNGTDGFYIGDPNVSGLSDGNVGNGMYSTQYVIDELRVFTRAKTTAEILADKDDTVNSLSQDLIYHLRMNDGHLEIPDSASGGSFFFDLIQDMSKLANHPAYFVVSNNKESPMRVAPAIPDEFVTRHQRDSMRRRGKRRFAGREFRTLGDEFHLRQVYVAAQRSPLGTNHKETEVS